MRLIILDSALKEAEGHHEHFASGLKAYLAASGGKTLIVGHRRMADQLRSSLDARAVFSNSLYDGISDDPYDGALTDFSVRADLFSQDLIASGVSVSDSDLLLLPTATPGEVMGLAKWLDTQEARPKIALIYHWGTSTWFRPGMLHPALHRTALRGLCASRYGDVRISATHEELASALAIVAEQSVTIASATFFRDDMHLATGHRLSDSSTRQPVIGIFGGMREGKGVELLPRILRTSIERNLRAHWLIQCHRSSGLPAGYKELRDFPEVTLLEHWLPEDELTTCLCRADIALLPYDVPTYKIMVSGVFASAAGYALPCVVPNLTWMSARIKAGDAAGLVYDSTDASEIVDVLETAVGGLEALSRRACELAPIWRIRFSANNYVDELISWYTEK